MKIVLGFDPGGENNFGWAVCRANEKSLTVIATGVTDHAEGAVKAVVKRLPEVSTVVGAGIDAPMFWVANGSRKVDDEVRKAIANFGAPFPSGTVQQVNSLRGACVVQGVLAALLLKDRYPHLPVTESHPKALLWLLGLANSGTHTREVRVQDLPQVECDSTNWVSEHERDAVIGAYTAWSMHKNLESWQDLFEIEENAILPVPGPVSYWMPALR